MRSSENEFSIRTKLMYINNWVHLLAGPSFVYIRFLVLDPKYPPFWHLAQRTRQDVEEEGIRREADLERSYRVTESCNFISENLICIKWTRSFMTKSRSSDLLFFSGYAEELSLW